MNSTPISSTFIGPVGTSRGCRMYRRTIAVMTTKSIAATSHSMNTCLVTDRSMPKIGRQMDQRVIGRAVRDVANDVEPFGLRRCWGDVLDPASSGVGPRSSWGLRRASIMSGGR